jgi:hypothetical protein
MLLPKAFMLRFMLQAMKGSVDEEEGGGRKEKVFPMKGTILKWLGDGTGVIR